MRALALNEGCPEHSGRIEASALEMRTSSSLSASTTNNKMARQMRQDEKLPEFKLILNPTDGSELAELATGHAVYLAKLTGAELLIRHVVETTFT